MNSMHRCQLNTNVYEIRSENSMYLIKGSIYKHFFLFLIFNLFILFIFFGGGGSLDLAFVLISPSPPQRPITSDFEGFSIPESVHYIYFPILILEEKEPVFSLSNVQC